MKTTIMIMESLNAKRHDLEGYYRLPLINKDVSFTRHNLDILEINLSLGAQLIVLCLKEKMTEELFRQIEEDLSYWKEE